MSFQVNHNALKVGVAYTGVGTPTETQILRAADWNKTHFTLQGGSGISLTSVGASPDTVTIALSGAATSSSGGNLQGNGTNPFFALFKSTTSVGSSIFQDDGTALKGTTDNTQDLGTLPLRWRNAYFGGTVSVGATGTGGEIHIAATSNTGMHFNADAGDYYFGYEFGAQPAALFGVNNDLRIGTNLSPLTDNANSLGLTNRRWQNIYATGSLRVSLGAVSTNYVQFSIDGSNNANITHSGTGTQINFNPVSGATLSYDGTVLTAGNNGRDIGSTSQNWRSAYFGTTISGGNVVANNVTVNGALTVGVNGSTSFSVSALPALDNLYDVGSLTFRWRAGYFGTTVSGGAGSFSSIGVGTLNATAINSNSSPVVAGTALPTGSGTSPFLVKWSGSGTQVASIFQDDATALKGTTDNTQDLGTTALRWRNVYIANTLSVGASSYLQENPGANLTISTVNTTLNVVGDTRPSVDNTYTLGTAAQRWKTGFFARLSVGFTTDPTTATGQLFASGIASAGGGFQTNTTSTFNALVQPYADNSFDLGVTATMRWRSGYFGTTISGGNAVLNNIMVNGSFTGAGGAISGIGTVAPFVDNSANIGTSSLRIANVNIAGSFQTWATAGDANPIIQIGSGGFQMGGGAGFALDVSVNRIGGNWQIKGQTYPNADVTYDLGSTALRWRSGYFGTTLSGGAVVGTTGTFNGNVALGRGFVLQLDSNQTTNFQTTNSITINRASSATMGQTIQFLTGLTTNFIIGRDINSDDFDFAKFDGSTLTKLFKIGNATGTASAGGGFQTNANPIGAIGGAGVITATSVGGQRDKMAVSINGVTRYIALYDS